MEGDHLEDTGVVRRIILKWNLERWDGNMDCIHLAQDTDKWKALVNAVTNFRFP
jgi:hypothetical protein